jgi:hypothetical protein
MLPPPPPRRQARNELKPPAAFRIPASTVQLRPLRAAAIGHLHADKAVPRADRDRDRPARSPRTLCRTLLPNSSLTSRAASSPHGCPGPSTPPTNARATRARSARPATVTLSRISRPAISAPAFPGRPRPREITGAARPDVRECTLDSAAHVKPEHATGAARPWPSVESRRCTPTVLAAGRRPLYARGRRDTGTYSATR